MADPDFSLRQFRAFQAFVASNSSAPDENLNSGDGGGTSGGMEARLARLESDMEHVKKTLDKLDRGQDAVRSEIASMSSNVAVTGEKLKHVPTVAKMWAAAIGIVGALGAIIGLAVRFIPHA